MSSYSYAEGNLLEARNNYFYTPYEGESFLEAWRLSRDEAKSTLGTASAPPTKTEPSISLDQFYQKIRHGENIETYSLFEWLYFSLEEGLFSSREGILDQIVKRFEVSKRIHAIYTASFRPLEKENFYDLSLYVFAAIIFEKAYSCSGKLTYLNALLKCLDTLSALSVQLPSAAKGNLSWLISREQGHIDALREAVNNEA